MTQKEERELQEYQQKQYEKHIIEQIEFEEEMYDMIAEQNAIESLKIMNGGK